jgi:hypothetical protein
MLGRVVLPGEMSFQDFSNNMNLNTGFFGMHGAGGVPAGGNNMQSPLQTALGLADGGRAAFAEGGIMDLGGNEMDLRGGGFVPLGAKEKADDVPARLSKNEFVMTADAVRAAGGGSVDKGADKMYKMMKQLEAQV